MRKRNKEEKNFAAHIYRYQRTLPSFKNLQYKKILSLQKKINLQKEEILFYNKSKILEGSTTNLIFVKNNQLFIPKNSYYFGITLSYLIKTIPYKIKKIDILQISIFMTETSHDNKSLYFHKVMNFST